MKRTTIPALCVLCATCLPQVQVSPKPSFTRIENAFIISKDVYQNQDTLTVFIDQETCEPDRALFLWRREGDTLSALLLSRTNDSAVVADVYEPVHLQAGIVNLYNEHSHRVDKQLVETILRRAQQVCSRYDDQYRARAFGERQS